ncbi:hypothetical protein EMCRGX_G028674 [Ephydatia muelleri]
MSDVNKEMIPESEGEKDSEAPSVLNQQGSSDKNRQGPHRNEEEEEEDTGRGKRKRKGEAGRKKEARGDECFCEEMSDIDEEEEDEDQEDVQEVVNLWILDAQVACFYLKTDDMTSITHSHQYGPRQTSDALLGAAYPHRKKRTWDKLKEKLKRQKEELKGENDELMQAGNNEAIVQTIAEKEKQLTTIMILQEEQMRKEILLEEQMKMIRKQLAEMGMKEMLLGMTKLGPVHHGVA